MCCADVKLFGSRFMARQLQVGLVGGSVASLILRALEEVSQTPIVLPAAAPLECPICPEVLHCAYELACRVHLASLLLGCLLGILVGPLIDTLYLLRVWWGTLVRSCLRSQAAPLYRILS